MIREYNSLFKLALQGAEVEPVHELRVRIKRLNALFVFLDEADIFRRSSKAFFQQLKSFFKSAGNLRDVQVLISLIGYYRNQIKEDFEEYDHYLKNKETNARLGFSGKSEEYPKDDQIKIKKEIIDTIRNISEDKLSRESFDFITKRLNRIEKYLIQSKTIKYLHKIRQTLKELRFFIEIFHSSSDLSLIEENDYNEIKEIENVLGGWNDRAILLDDIKRFLLYKQRLGSDTSGHALKSLRKMVRKDMKSMVSDIKPRLLKFIYHLKYSML